MIGHFLLTLTEEQEDRVLTGPMRRWSPGRRDNAEACLLERAAGELDKWQPWHWPTYIEWRVGEPNQRRLVACVSDCYDNLFDRFGERVNVAIRNRILSNRARRALLSGNPLSLSQSHESVTAQ